MNVVEERQHEKENKNTEFLFIKRRKTKNR